jgi:hypothetical protein
MAGRCKILTKRSKGAGRGTTIEEHSFCEQKQQALRILKVAALRKIAAPLKSCAPPATITQQIAGCRQGQIGHPRNSNQVLDRRRVISDVGIRVDVQDTSRPARITEWMSRMFILS